MTRAIKAQATTTPALGRTSAASVRKWRTSWLALAAFTTRWTWADRGWLIIALLGVLNVFAHGAALPATAHADIASVTELVREHARLFLILLATIYAGELVWRDADERVAELVLSTPISTARLVSARLVGLSAAQATLVAALLCSAWLAVGVSQMFVPLHKLLLIGALWILVPFLQWTTLSLAVHVVVRNKIVGHLVLIAGWVLAVVLDANGVTSPWVRFADPPTLMAGAPPPIHDALVRALWWSAVSAMLCALTVRLWRGVTSRR